MENYFKISEVSQLVERDWTPENGQKKTIASVEVVLTNGIDVLVAEANDDLARNIASMVEKKELDTTALWNVRLKFAVRKSKDKGILFNSIRIFDMAKV